MHREGETSHLIRHQKRFLLSMCFFIVVMIINFPFPHEQAFAAASLSIMNLQSSNGLHYLAMLSVVLLCIGMYLLGTSLEKYRVRSIFLTFVLISIVPHVLTNIIQNTIATGIYAVDYDKESSLCEFNMVDDKKKVITATCAFTFENLSNKRVDFGIRFQETDPYLFNFSSYLNEGAPHQVSLQAKERKTIHLSLEFDPDHLESFEGTSGYVSIQLIKGKKFRNL